MQIHHDAEILGQYTGLTLGLAFGGVDYDKQRRVLEDGVDVLIGTPGRLIDFYKQRVFDLRAIQVVILDEADRMFDLGFITDIRYIMRRLPAPDQRLNMLFSATLAQRVLELAFEHMNDPELVRIEPDKMTVDRVRQVIYYPSMDEKPRLLVGLLKQMDPHRTMIFVNTRRGADELETLLKANGFNAEAMSGDVPQTKRLRMIRDFHSGELAILIGTDVASRGLHIPDVSHVFNYDLPQDPEDYVHRIGRTARAGAEGDAISLGCEDFVQSLPDIEDYIGRKHPGRERRAGIARRDHRAALRAAPLQRARAAVRTAAIAAWWWWRRRRWRSWRPSRSGGGGGRSRSAGGPPRRDSQPPRQDSSPAALPTTRGAHSNGGGPAPAPHQSAGAEGATAATAPRASVDVVAVAAARAHRSRAMAPVARLRAVVTPARRPRTAEPGRNRAGRQACAGRRCRPRADAADASNPAAAPGRSSPPARAAPLPVPPRCRPRTACAPAAPGAALQLFPELRVLLRHAEFMRRHQLVEMPRQLRLRILDLQAERMRVGGEQHALARGPQQVEEFRPHRRGSGFPRAIRT